ncbi:hypothetical protein RHMOL_Rhmol11G0047500 [Rhododendron molle]|uniref:Uncharacterized protein n=1 Tax=Rhododendron molle TaxID=49168 RepID=A0ACC0LNV3_RHOML|nr:hypothetical protein RHMOL_Rhmol11G0047500 [Rhododendron molle]
MVCLECEKQGVQEFGTLEYACRLATTVYGIWRERNVRVFQNLLTQVDVVSLSIINSIRDFLCSRRRVKRSALNRSLGASWRLPDSVFSV